MALTSAEEAQTRELLAQQAAILSLADNEAEIVSNLGATDVSLSDLTPVVSIADADLMLARQGVTDKSVSADVLAQYITTELGVTPPRLDNDVSLATTEFVNFTGPVAGSMRNGKMSVTTASALATFTADEIIVETALGGAPLRLANFSQAVNLAATGAGGMDTGAAPVSGYVALYAIYNPTTLASALLAVNATAAVQPSVYGGANMPSGYAASALVSVWPTNASSQFVIGCQFDRQVSIAHTQVLSTATQQVTLTLLSIATAVPKNAKSASGYVGISATTSAASGLFNVASSATVGQQLFSHYCGQVSTAYTCPFSSLQLLTPQTVYYMESVSAGDISATMFINGYSF